MSGRNAIRVRLVNGGAYIRKEDVVAYLLDTAGDWRKAGVDEVFVVALEEIAQQLGRV